MDLLCAVPEGRDSLCKKGILLSVHPADRYLYLELIKNTVLNMGDYAVYYAPFPMDGIFPDFSHISLVIMAVTEKYLVWQNSGFSSEAIPATQKSIPVLPLMMEKGLSNLFNTRCGKLQYVDCTDPEQIPKKLQKHLPHALDGHNDRQSEGVLRRVFISYRKRDIDYLNRLSGAITAHPQSKHVCLWYDTGLLPGENYSDAILDALNTCDLYVLLVTPSLLEEGNYVYRVEYPLAVQKGKPIVAVEMQKTDKTRLLQMYPSLPKCITEKQVDALFARLGI